MKKQKLRFCKKCKEAPLANWNQSGVCQLCKSKTEAGRVLAFVLREEQPSSV